MQRNFSSSTEKIFNFRIFMFLLIFKKLSYLREWSICVDCSFSKRCTIARRFSNACVNACFKLVRNADRGPPFPFSFGVAVVVGIDVAVFVAQSNATNNRKVFILMSAKTVNCK